ncbi:tRNA/rRNA methyltransferase [Aeromonas veronii]|uniref:tRNA/rRNA methyltransferase n=1 Tax=Aeromonas TaxID=642 RepID=UPI000206A292|nr:tRNA/rRNA methyltransferase [Aeromonas veronii]AEB50849.1 RNA methyltransferase, TrmH family, group 1 [Aeromonas veronii B565]EKB15577.1 RNA methyltransferase, TrmH family, group 1 [Aeromonas veronii AER397]MBS4690606.1 tRNA/rRNA methyltransferase [Aeromonas veronii bv. veronii]MCS0539990.1 tRNA/rRNA methyltransferase [Aeromonas veronii]MCX9132782.1 tRNA/rRNA methyltransferase [Aeromonas veronii]
MKLYFVLVAPARPANVGAAARAMKTMGFDAMRLVASRVHEEEEASWVAHGAQEILTQAEAFDTLPEALADMDLVIATTARERGRYQHYLTPGEIREQIRSKPSLNKVAIVFGCEESGLSNEQLAEVDLISYLPLKVSYPSLNLGQAIMLYAYEMSQLMDELNADGGAAVAENFDNAGQVRVLKSKTAELLGELGVSQDEKLHQWVMDRVPMLPQRDLNMLHLLCKDLARRFGRE